MSVMNAKNGGSAYTSRDQVFFSLRSCHTVCTVVQDRIARYITHAHQEGGRRALVDLVNAHSAHTSLMVYLRRVLPTLYNDASSHEPIFNDIFFQIVLENGDSHEITRSSRGRGWLAWHNILEQVG